jgi:hypothetical protein
MVRRAGVCVPRGSVAAGYASSTNLANGYADRPGYAYGPGPGPAYGTGYMAGPRHDLGGPARMGDMCWSDKDPWANTGIGYWKAC